MHSLRPASRLGYVIPLLGLCVCSKFSFLLGRFLFGFGFGSVSDSFILALFPLQRRSSFFSGDAYKPRGFQYFRPYLVRGGCASRHSSFIWHQIPPSPAEHIIIPAPCNSTNPFSFWVFQLGICLPSAARCIEIQLSVSHDGSSFELLPAGETQLSLLYYYYA